MSATLLEKLAESGLLALLLAISLGVIAFLYRKNEQLNKDRYNDLKEIWQKDMQEKLEWKTIINTLSQFLSRGGQR